MRVWGVEEGSEIHLLKCLAQYKVLIAVLIIEDVTQEDFKVCGLSGQKLRIIGNLECAVQ